MSPLTYLSSKLDSMSEEFCARAYDVLMDLVYIGTAFEPKVGEFSGNEQPVCYEFRSIHVLNRDTCSLKEIIKSSRDAVPIFTAVGGVLCHGKSL